MRTVSIILVLYMAGCASTSETYEQRIDREHREILEGRSPSPPPSDPGLQVGGWTIGVPTTK